MIQKLCLVMQACLFSALPAANLQLSYEQGPINIIEWSGPQEIQENGSIALSGSSFQEHTFSISFYSNSSSGYTVSVSLSSIGLGESPAIHLLTLAEGKTVQTDLLQQDGSPLELEFAGNSLEKSMQGIPDQIALSIDPPTGEENDKTIPPPMNIITMLVAPR